jgi:2-oxoglutarate ferredoxin oxidoreductase subunit alpha
MLLGDGMLGQMMEGIDEDLLQVKVNEYPKPWALRGCKGREPQVIKSLYLNPDEMEEVNLRLQSKYKEIQEREVLYEEILTDDAQILIIAYGTVARICKGVIRDLRRNGVKVGLFRPISLWPFPSKRLRELSDKVRAILVVEMSAGQMLEDVKAAVGQKVKVEFLGRLGGNIPSEDEICKKLEVLVK